MKLLLLLQVSELSDFFKNFKKIKKACFIKLCTMQLDQWQKEILEHDGNMLLCTGRQVGKTTIFAIKAAEYMLNNPASRIIVVSLTEDQAHLIVIMILTYLEKNYITQIAKGKLKPTKSKIALKNKSSVLSRPVGNTGDAVRGFTGDVLIIDEAAGMPEMMWAGAKPTLASTGGQIWMCSTPRGKIGYFYECWLNKNKRYKVVHTNTLQVYEDREISEEWTQKRKTQAIEFLAFEKESMSTLQYGQEYMGQFLEDLQQFFPDEMIRRCMTARRPDTIDIHADFYIGVDIGRYGADPSTFEIFRRTEENSLIQVESQVTSKTLLTQTARHIIGLDTSYDFEKIYIDDEGIGIGVFDILISEEQTRRRVIGLKNSKKVIDYKTGQKTKMQKELLYMNLLNLMERGEITLLEDDAIFQSFKSVQYEYAKDKKGKNFMHIFGNNTHIVEGVIRAAWSTKDKNLNNMISSFKI